MSKFSASKNNQLCAVDIDGTYDFYTMVICIEKYCSTDWDEVYKLIQKKGYSLSEYQKLSMFLGLLYHEYTHFIDCTSTIWGMNLLNTFYDSYLCHVNTKHHGGKEFYYSKIFFNRIENLRYPKFFTEEYEVENKKINSFCESIGLKFKSDGYLNYDDPILFFNYLNDKNERILRFPISEISILECSAKSQEIYIYKTYLDRLDENQRAVELALYNQNLEKHIYDIKLAEYSVCYFIYSQYTGIKDYIECYLSCGIICRYILNSPDSVYDSIYNNFEFKKIDRFKQFDEESILRFKKGIKNKNPGFLFLLICSCLVRYIELDHSTIGKILEEKVFPFLGISDFIDKMNEEAEKIKEQNGYRNTLERMRIEDNISVQYLKNNFNGIDISSIERPVKSIEFINNIFEKSYENLKKIKLNDISIELEQMSIPPTLFKDNEYRLCVGNNIYNSQNIKDIEEFLLIHQDRVKLFSQACL